MDIQDKLYFSQDVRSRIVQAAGLVEARPVRVELALPVVDVRSLAGLTPGLLAGLYEIELGRLFCLTQATGSQILEYASSAVVERVEPADAAQLSPALQRQCLASRKFMATDTIRESLTESLEAGELSKSCPRCVVVLLEGLTPECPALWPYVPGPVTQAFDPLTGLAVVTPVLGQLIGMVSSPFCHSVQIETPYVLFGGDGSR
jgi:hypothetical protein